MNVGDWVEWSSHARDHSLTKAGEIVEVVEPGHRPLTKWNVKEPGLARRHESYVVYVQGRGHYWPVVSKLRAIERPVLA